MPVFAHDRSNSVDTGHLAVLMVVAEPARSLAPCFCFPRRFRRQGRRRRRICRNISSLEFHPCVFTSPNLRLSLISLFGMGFAVVIAIAGNQHLAKKVVTDEMEEV